MEKFEVRWHQDGNYRHLMLWYLLPHFAQWCNKVLEIFIEEMVYLHCKLCLNLRMTKTFFLTLKAVLPMPFFFFPSSFVLIIVVLSSSGIYIYISLLPHSSHIMFAGLHILCGFIWFVSLVWGPASNVNRPSSQEEFMGNFLLYLKDLWSKY